jgi:hypothetical protein
MKIEIKSRFDSSKIIVCGEYESVKDCLEKNRSANLSLANLSLANLSSADLRSANLYLANLRSANLSLANLSLANLSSANLRWANLSWANLSWANLSSADLRSANLYLANLRSADLTDIKGYSESHDIFQELCRQQDSKTFTDAEWSMIGFVVIHRICWDAIKKRYGKKMLSVFKKLTKKGWGEYETRYREELK